jgi:hypothetical protein
LSHSVLTIHVILTNVLELLTDWLLVDVDCVQCEVRTDILYIIYRDISFKGLINFGIFLRMCFTNLKESQITGTQLWAVAKED